MKKVVLFLLIVTVLFNFVACGGGSSGGSNSSDENLEIISIVLDSDNTIITSDNKELVTFQLYGIDASGNSLTIKNVDLYKDGEKYNSTNFKTSTSGTYTFYAKYKEFKSNSITITVNEKAEYKEEKTNVTVNNDTKDILGESIITKVYTSTATQNFKNNESNINFQTENSYKPSLVIAENDNGNAILLGVNHRGETSNELSIRSTAMALVLYDPYIMKLSKENYLIAKDYLEKSSKLIELENLIKQNIKNYPDNPLLNNSSENIELYTKALVIVNDIRKYIESSKKTIIKRGDLSDYKALGIIDDKNKNEDVYIFNQTFCMYNATVKTGDKLDKKFGDTLFLNRRPLAEIQLIDWDENGIVFDPTIKMEETVRIPKLGDIYFGIEYEKLKKETLYMLVVQVFFDAVGIGFDAALEKNDLNLVINLFYKYFQGFVNSMNTMLIEKPANKEKAYEQAYKLLKEAASMGYEPIISFLKELAEQKAFNYLKNKFSEKFAETTIKIFLKKATLMVTIGYDVIDVGAVLWDIHFAPDNHEILGIQNKGKYPADPIMVETENVRTDTSTFYLKNNKVKASYYLDITAPGAKIIKTMKEEYFDGSVDHIIIFDYKPIKDYDFEYNIQVFAEPENTNWTITGNTYTWEVDDETFSRTDFNRYTIYDSYYDFESLLLYGKIKSIDEMIDFDYDFKSDSKNTNIEKKTYKIKHDYNYPIGGFAVTKIFNYTIEEGYWDKYGAETITNTWNDAASMEIFSALHQWTYEVLENSDDDDWDYIDAKYSEKRNLPSKKRFIEYSKNNLFYNYLKPIYNSGNIIR